MSYKDDLKKTQNMEKSNVKLEVVRRLESKATIHENQKVPALQEYVKSEVEGEKGEKKAVASISGILIGNAMRLKVFDRSISSQYVSGAFWNKEMTVSVYLQGKKQLSGKVTDMEEWMSKKAGDRTKKVSMLYVLTPKGLVEIETNLVLNIDALKKIKNFKDELLKFTPIIYDPNDIRISKNTKEYLGKFANTNRPCWVSIERLTDKSGNPMQMTDEMWNAWNGPSVVQNYMDWKNGLMNFVGDENPSEIEGVEVAPVENKFNSRPRSQELKSDLRPTNKITPNYDATKTVDEREDSLGAFEDELNDLPF